MKNLSKLFKKKLYIHSLRKIHYQKFSKSVPNNTTTESVIKSLTEPKENNTPSIGKFIFLKKKNKSILPLKNHVKHIKVVYGII